MIFVSYMLFFKITFMTFVSYMYFKKTFTIFVSAKFVKIKIHSETNLVSVFKKKTCTSFGLYMCSRI